MLTLKIRLAALTLSIPEMHRNAILALADRAVGRFMEDPDRRISKLGAEMSLIDDPSHRKLFKICTDSLLSGKYKQSVKYAALVVTQMEMIAEEVIKRNGLK